MNRMDGWCRLASTKSWTRVASGVCESQSPREEPQAHPGRICHQGTKIEGLNVEAFEMMQDGRTKVALAHSSSTIHDDSWSVDAHLVQRY